MAAKVLSLLVLVTGCLLALEPVERKNHPGVLLLQGGFVHGDSRTVQRELSRKAFREVWLHSGGGDSNEGFLVGQVFRRMQVTVRIPAGATCASACTVAFMGGMFRYIDIEGNAAYKVHAASSWARGFSCPPEEPKCHLQKFYKDLEQDPSEALLKYARSEQIDGRFTAKRRMTHFQKTLLIPLGYEAEDLDRRFPEHEASFEYWARTDPPPLPYTREQLKEDVRRFQAEGAPAAQDILMRIERESLGAGIRDLRAIVGKLGPRADHALRMIEVMWQTSIKETAVLNQGTLIAMGFVTKDYVSPNR